MQGGSMQVQIRKWGNSLAVRIPSSVLEKARVTEGSRLEIAVQKSGTIALMPTKTTPTLQQLVDGITDDNLHHETETGPAVGNEIW
jgi:antitoxin MazE